MDSFILFLEKSDQKKNTLQKSKHCVLQKDAGIKNLELFCPSIINLISVYTHYTHNIYIDIRRMHGLNIYV